MNRAILLDGDGNKTLAIASPHTVRFEKKDAYLSSVMKTSFEGAWCSIGTSITWYNDHPNGTTLTKGYQDRVRDIIKFSGFINYGVSGGRLAEVDINNLPVADYYTIEHGINDWGHSIAVGNRNDYIQNSTNGTFYSSYRRLIDAIYSKNPKAKIILCTPRKGRGFGSYLPANCEDAKNGIYLIDYANAINEISKIESLPVCDWFGGIQCNNHNLASLSIDDALHPNDAGMQMMADLLIKKIIFGGL